MGAQLHEPSAPLVSEEALAARASLTRAQHDAYVLYRRGETFAAAGRELGISPQAFRYRVGRAQKRLGYPVTVGSRSKGRYRFLPGHVAS